MVPARWRGGPASRLRSGRSFGLLADLQDALAALVTDLAFLERFERAPAEALAARWPDLAPDERASLVALDAAALRRCAEGLIAKRWDDLRKVTPLSARVAPALRRHHRRWLESHPATAADTVLGPGEAEALRALPALAARLQADDDAPPWAAELLAYEVLAACSARDGHERFARAGCAVHEIAALLRAGQRPALDAEPAPHRYRFTRAGVQHRREGET